MQQDRNDILTQPMGRLFLRMAIPGIIGTVVMGLYNFVDAIFLGQLIGPTAVGAVGLLFTLVIMNQGILALMGSGSGAVLSVAMGQQDDATIDRLLGNLIPVTFFGSALFAVLVGVFGYGGGLSAYLGPWHAVYGHRGGDEHAAAGRGQDEGGDDDRFRFLFAESRS